MLEAGTPHHRHYRRGTTGTGHDHCTGTTNSNGKGQVVGGYYMLGTGGLEGLAKAVQQVTRTDQ